MSGLQGKIMWNVHGFMDTEIDKSQQVNMAINSVFFHTTLIQDSLGVGKLNPNHITRTVLDKKILHEVEAQFSLKGTPVHFLFSYDYPNNVLFVTTRIDDVIQQTILRETLEGIDVEIRSGQYLTAIRKVMDRQFILNDPDSDKEPTIHPQLVLDAGQALENNDLDEINRLADIQLQRLDGEWVESLFENQELAIDGVIRLIISEFPELQALGYATKLDWQYEEAQSFPEIPDQVVPYHNFRIGQDSFFLARVKEYAAKLTGDDTYVGNLNWMQNSMNWWALREVVERTIEMSRTNPDRILIMKPQVQRAWDAYQASNSKGVGRAGMESNTSMILQLTDFILSYKPD